ncbi:hypothetical protein ACFWAR_19520 [Streptomyces sp. NPDC059917]|uniref:hypothetical protein n=1 Tax=Streptomyces sp. NPDC059917 TaxID=3347002 RepID=UPI00365EB90A
MTTTYDAPAGPGGDGDMDDLLVSLHGRDTIECVSTYQRLGWPVALGYRHRPGAGCTCLDIPAAPPCTTPGAHPTGDATPLKGRAAARAFAAAPGAGVIVCCTGFDAVILAHAIGMSAMLRLDGAGLHVPCLTAAHDTATLLVQEGTGALLAEHPGVQVRAGREAWVAMPPSYGVRWDTAPLLAPLLPAAAVRPHIEQVLKLASPARVQG